jgi:PleD family two-component response regulator
MDDLDDITVDAAIRTIRRLREERDAARRKISDASAIMCDWDGFFDPNTQEGNIVELAILIEESYRILNGRSWDKEVAK